MYEHTYQQKNSYASKDLLFLPHSEIHNTRHATQQPQQFFNPLYEYRSDS